MAEEQALAATEEACRVYVGNLLPRAKESHLTSEFARFGTIHSVWIARRPPGFAFVRFASPDAAQRAVEACGRDGALEILGKAVRVQMAGDKRAKQSAESRKQAVDGDRRRRSRSARLRASERRETRHRSTSSSRRRARGRERRDRRSRSSSRDDYRRGRFRSRSRSRRRSLSRSRSRRRDGSGSRSRSRSRERTVARRSSSSPSRRRR